MFVVLDICDRLKEGGKSSLRNISYFVIVVVIVMAINKG